MHVRVLAGAAVGAHPEIVGFADDELLDPARDRALFAARRDSEAATFVLRELRKGQLVHLLAAVAQDRLSILLERKGFARDVDRVADRDGVVNESAGRRWSVAQLDLAISD